MRKIIIPEGKELFIPLGKYRWRGPCEVSEQSLVQKTVPIEFTDGTEWEWTNEDGTKDTPDTSAKEVEKKAESPKAKKPAKKKAKSKAKKIEVTDDQNELPPTEGTTQEPKDQKKATENPAGDQDGTVSVAGDLQ